MKDKKVTFEKKLAKYSALAAGVALAGSAQAQIVYTDINDTTIMQTDSLMLDLNNDGIADFKIKAEKYSYSSSGSYYGYTYIVKLKADFVFVEGTDTINEVLNSYVASSYSSGTYYPKALNLMDSIKNKPTNNSELWVEDTYGILNGKGYYYMKFGSNTSSNNIDFGQFDGVMDKYLAFRFGIKGKMHLGWVRLDVAADGKSFTVKSYAYETQAETDILAGYTGGPVVEADLVSDLVVKDVSDNSNASDISVTFTKATDESGIDEYRAIVVKSANASSFGLSAASALTNDRYTQIAKTGGNINVTLNANLKDSDGDDIALNSEYKIYILSVADGTNANTNALYTESGAVVTLHSTVDQVSNVVLSDIADNGDASDLNIAFNMAADESRLSEYRVFLVKSSKASAFDLAAANSNSNYFKVSANGSNINTVLGSGLKDTDGDAIANGSSLKAFVLSLANGTDADINALSAVSNEVVLSKTNSIDEPLKEVAVYVSDNMLIVNNKSNYEVLEFLSVSGQVLFSQKINQDNHLQINLNTIDAGVYLVRLLSDTQVETQKVFVK